MIRRIAALGLAGIACLLCALGTGLLTAHTLGISPGVWAVCFNRFADTASFGVARDQYPRLARALGAYLSGEAPGAQVTILRQGAAAAAYNEKELTHLEDVKTLMDALRRWGALALGAAALLFALPGRRWKRGTVRGGAVLAGAALAGGLAWGLADFYTLFTLVHRLLFTNELWLMDPSRDLIITLMPQEVFMALGTVVALGMAGSLLLIGLTAGRRKK